MADINYSIVSPGIIKFEASDYIENITQVKPFIAIYHDLNTNPYNVVITSDDYFVEAPIKLDVDYYIQLVLVHIWDAGTGESIVENEVVHYDYEYWMNISGGLLTEGSSPDPGSDYAKWKKMGYYDMHRNLLPALRVRNIYTLEINGSVLHHTYIPLLSECNVWRYKNNESFNQIINLFNYSGDMVESFELASTDEYVDMAVPEDGTYYIEVYKEGEEFGDNPTTDVSIPIYSYCNARKCLKGLISTILCLDACDEPCSKEDAVKKYTITKMTSLMYLLDRYIKVEENKYYGTMIIDAERREFIGMVNKIGTVLKAVVNRCGECGETTTTSSPCNGCN